MSRKIPATLEAKHQSWASFMGNLLFLSFSFILRNSFLLSLLLSDPLCLGSSFLISCSLLSFLNSLFLSHVPNGLLFSDPPLPFPLVQPPFPRPVSSDPFLLQLSGWLPISIQSEDQGGETCRGEFITFLKNHLVQIILLPALVPREISATRSISAQTPHRWLRTVVLLWLVDWGGLSWQHQVQFPGTRWLGMKWSRTS